MKSHNWREYDAQGKRAKATRAPHARLATSLLKNNTCAIPIKPNNKERGFLNKLGY